MSAPINAQLLVLLTPDEKMALHLHSVGNKKTMSSLVRDLIRDYMKNEGLTDEPELVA